MATQEQIDRMLYRLAQAKTWPGLLLQEVKDGKKVQTEIDATGEKITRLETEARTLIQSMGCTDPQSQTLNRATADMMINWYHFLDRELPRARSRLR